MKIFIAWSKDASGAIGNALHDWLADISDDFTPIISTQDIQVGNVWRAALGEELEDADYGILCITEENLSSPWLCYEAGALGISTAFHDQKNHAPHVLPIRFGNVNASQIASPIQDFQSKPFTKEEMLAFVVQLNKYYRSVSENKRNLMDERDITRKFERSYDALESKVQAILAKAEEERILSEKKVREERYDELERALLNFRSDDSPDQTLFMMGELVLGKLRNKDLTTESRKFVEIYLDLLKDRKYESHSNSARDLQSVLTGLLNLPTAH